MNFEQVYNEFLEYATRRHKKQGFETLRNNFNSHILPFFKGNDIFELKKADILYWHNTIYDKNNSFNNNLYVVFNEFFTYCCDYHNVKENLVKQVGNFKKRFEDQKFDFYTLKEFNQFIKCVDNNIYKQYFNLLFYCGTRPNEATALKFSDLQGDYISINKILTTKGGREFDTPKTLSSIRKIKIDRKLKADLLLLKDFYINKYNNKNYDYFIFGGLKPLAPTSINRHKINACNKADIRPITLHQFRHSHATLLLHNGVVINEISRRLGHNKVSTTLDVYTHTDLSQEKRVQSTLNSIRFNFFETLRNNFKKIIYILKHISML